MPHKHIAQHSGSHAKSSHSGHHGDGKHHVAAHHTHHGSGSIVHHHYKTGGPVPPKKYAKGEIDYQGKEPLVAAGNPNVVKEGEGTRRKKGGKLKLGGKATHKRLDRRRRTGGRIGADVSPLTGAHHTETPESRGSYYGFKDEQASGRR